jgi:hypothetical protein
MVAMCIDETGSEYEAVTDDHSLSTSSGKCSDLDDSVIEYADRSVVRSRTRTINDPNILE